ncbi:MAG: tRNA sulfurtransferase, partial [Acutalibacteraceae bacterium]
MKEILLVKLGEIVLKGLNRKAFEDTLIKNLKRRLAAIGKFQVRSAQSTITVTPVYDDADMDEAADCVSKVFGIATFSRACVAEKDIETIKQSAAEYLADMLEGVDTFKVEAKRSDKKFPLTSPQICTEVGGYLLGKFPHLSVDVHNPDITVTVEVRDLAAYVRAGVIKGAGGIPVGTGGKAAVLISGGIDSPVASYMMAKRGLELTAIHFASPPYTSERAEEKVVELLKKVSAYSGRMNMYTVPFTKIQEQIKEKCHEEYFTIIMRRFMMKIAERVAKQN